MGHEAKKVLLGRAQDYLANQAGRLAGPQCVAGGSKAGIILGLRFWRGKRPIKAPGLKTGLISA
jgi:hypothetical protein